MMKIYALTILAALLVQASVLVQGGAGWGGKESTAPELSQRKQELVAEKAREASPPSDGGEDMPESSMAKSPSPARAWKIAGDTGATARSHSKPATSPQLGSSKQNATSKQQRPQPQQPLRAKNNGLSNFLKGHGKFNSDTYACAAIQSRTCQKPSDCDGCLGLYTCKLPRGKCDLKAVSRETGGFQQSLRST